MDEAQPLLRSITNEGQQVYTNPPLLQDDSSDGAGTTTIVDFDPRGDPENPLEWPTPFKWTVVSMLAFMAFTVYAPLALMFIHLGVFLAFLPLFPP